MLKQSISKVFLALSGVLFIGCATTPTEKVYRNMLVAASLGVLAGQSQPEYKNTHSTMYGGVAASIAGALTLYIENPDKETKKLRDEIVLLTNNQNQFEKGKVVNRGDAIFDAKIPEKYRSLVNPGEWKVYEIDQWQEEGENRLIHRDRVMELSPPSLVPGR